MRTSHKLLAAALVASALAATGSAFTAGGLTSTAGASAFVGGSVSQSITGATLTSTAYTVDGNNKVTGIALGFDAAANGKTLAVTYGGVAYTCSAIAAAAATCTGTADNTGDALVVTVT